MKRWFGILSSVVIIAISLVASPVFSQLLTWRHIGTIGDNLTCAYFWSDQAGVVGGDEMSYTTDGKTWHRSITPHSIPYVASIRCFDGKTLYAQTSIWDELWKSTDRGATWDSVKSGKGTDVYWDYVHNTVAILPDTIGSTVARMDKTNLIAATEDKTIPPRYSSDGGMTWQLGTFRNSPSNLYHGGFGAYADTFNKKYYVTSEYGTMEIATSTDMGQSWWFLPNSPPDYAVDDLEGFGGRLYVHGQAGVDESTDGGTSWTHLGGPGRLYDNEHFFLFGCEGSGIVVMDDSGGVWIAHENVAAITSPISMTVPAPTVGCKGVRASVTLANPNCQGLQLTQVTAPTLLSLQPFDSLITSFDTLRFDFLPRANDTNTVESIHLKGYYAPSHTKFDTTVFITVQYHPSTLLSASAQSLDLKWYGPCQGFDTTLILSNLSCDTIHVSLSQTNLASGWIVSPSSGIVSLAPGELDTIRIHYGGKQAGTFSQRLNYPFQSSKPGQVSVDFTAKVPTTTPTFTLSTSSFDAGMRSYCTDTIVDIQILDGGCDSLLITNARIQGNGAFTLLNTGGTALGPGQSLTRHVQYHALRHGQQFDTLVEHISHLDGSGGLDTSVKLAVTIVRGPTTLSVSTTKIDVDTTYICEERNASVTIRNPSCDTVCITAASIVPALFVLESGQPTRFCLGPGDSAVIRFTTKIDTSGHPLMNSALLTIISDAKQPFPPIVLTREIRYPVTWQLAFESPDSSLPGDIDFHRILQLGRLPVDDTSLDFVISYDADMLTFLQADEAGVIPGAYSRTPDGLGHQNFHVAPIPSGPVVATLRFVDFLARSGKSPLLLSGTGLSSKLGRSQDCIAAIPINRGDTSDFTTRQLCGSDLLRLYMNGIEISLDNIVPNPAHEEARITYSSQALESISGNVKLEDVMGRTVFQNEIIINPMAQGELTIPLAQLPSGIYELRIEASGGSPLNRRGFAWSKRLVKE